MRNRPSAAIVGAGAMVAVATVALAGPGDGAEPRKGAVVQERIDAVVAAGAPGVVARLEEGGRHWARAAGVAELGRPSPLPPQARFRVGSVTKTFVAALVLQLVEEGRIQLDGAVSAVLPGLLPHAGEVTVRQLLGHTSGLADYTADPSVFEGARQNRAFRPEELVGLVAGLGVRFAPGTAFEYSNTNYAVAGLLVERVTGNPVGDELERRILGPLGLGHTSFPTTSGDIAGVHARGYVLAGPGQPLLDVTSINPSHAWAAGAVVSTAADVDRFFGALLSGEVVGPEMVAAMQATTPIPGDSATSYGLGLMRVDTPCGTFWGNHGEIWGYHAWSFHAADGSRSLTEMVSLMPRPDEVDNALEGVHALLCDPSAGG